MKPQEEKQKFGQGKATKPRFKIEKLEERIAPRHGPDTGFGSCHYNPHGKLVGHCF